MKLNLLHDTAAPKPKPEDKNTYSVLSRTTGEFKTGSSGNPQPRIKAYKYNDLEFSKGKGRQLNAAIVIKDRSLEGLLIQNQLGQKGCLNKIHADLNNDSAEYPPEETEKILKAYNAAVEKLAADKTEPDTFKVAVISRQGDTYYFKNSRLKLRNWFHRIDHKLVEPGEVVVVE